VYRFYKRRYRIDSRLGALSAIGADTVKNRLRFTEPEAVMCHKMLLHLLYKSAVRAYRFSAVCAFKMKMSAVAFVVSVNRALSDVSRKAQNASFAYKALKASVRGSLRCSESVYYLVSAYATVFLFQVFENSLSLTGFVSVFSVDVSQLPFR